MIGPSSSSASSNSTPSSSNSSRSSFLAFSSVSASSRRTLNREKALMESWSVRETSTSGSEEAEASSCGGKSAWFRVAKLTRRTMRILSGFLRPS